jgi:hypothetical protein
MTSKDDTIARYREVFRQHGFGDHMIDFSDASAETIHIMAEALQAPRKGETYHYADHPGFTQKIHAVRTMVIFDSGSSLFLDTFLAGKPQRVTVMGRKR